jgi:hypothetical protein
MMVTVPAVATAQQRLELTPFVASYYGLTHLATGTNPNTGNDFNFDQSNAFSFGGRITLPVSARISLEGEFTFAMSGVRLTENDLFGPDLDGGLAQDGNVIYGSLRGVFTPRRSNLILVAGPAIIRRGGEAWDGVDGSDITDFGGVAGLGFRANVTPRFRVNFLAETYLYSFDGGTGNSKFQADLLFSLGVPIALGH